MHMPKYSLLVCDSCTPKYYEQNQLVHTALAFERRFGNQIKAFVVRFSGVATALSSRFVETRGQMRFAGIEKRHMGLVRAFGSSI